MFEFYPELLQQIAESSFPLWKHFIPKPSQVDEANKLHKKFIEASQQHWIQTKPRTPDDENYDQEFVDTVKERFRGFQKEGEDWFN